MNGQHLRETDIEIFWAWHFRVDLRRDEAWNVVEVKPLRSTEKHIPLVDFFWSHRHTTYCFTLLHCLTQVENCFKEGTQKLGRPLSQLHHLFESSTHTEWLYSPCFGCSTSMVTTCPWGGKNCSFFFLLYHILRRGVAKNCWF